MRHYVVRGYINARRMTHELKEILSGIKRLFTHFAPAGLGDYFGGAVDGGGDVWL